MGWKIGAFDIIYGKYKAFLLVISEVSLKLECTTKTKMTKLMKTSCAALDRLLNSDNDSLTLSTLESAAAALDKKLNISIT